MLLRKTQIHFFSLLPELPKRPKQKNSCSKIWLIHHLYIKLGFFPFLVHNIQCNKHAIKDFCQACLVNIEDRKTCADELRGAIHKYNIFLQLFSPYIVFNTWILKQTNVFTLILGYFSGFSGFYLAWIFVYTWLFPGVEEVP